MSCIINLKFTIFVDFIYLLTYLLTYLFTNLLNLLTYLFIYYKIHISVLWDIVLTYKKYPSKRNMESPQP